MNNTLKKEIKKEMFYANQVFRILFTATLQDEGLGIESKSICRIVYLEKVYRKYQKERYYLHTGKKIKLDKSNILLPKSYKKYKKKLKKLSTEDLYDTLCHDQKQLKDKEKITRILDEDIQKVSADMTQLKSQFLDSYELLIAQISDALKKEKE